MTPAVKVEDDARQHAEHREAGQEHRRPEHAHDHEAHAGEDDQQARIRRVRQGGSQPGPAVPDEIQGDRHDQVAVGEVLAAPILDEFHDHVPVEYAEGDQDQREGSERQSATGHIGFRLGPFNDASVLRASSAPAKSGLRASAA